MRLAERREGEAVSDEPKTLTLTFEETVEALGREGMEFRVESPTGKGVSWGVHQWRVVLVCCCYGTWPEAASAALGVRVVARDEAAELRAALRTLVTDLEDLMEDYSLRYDYTGEGHPEQVGWHDVLQGGRDNYLTNWNEAKRLAGGEEQE